jgi:hypothetical protein
MIVGDDLVLPADTKPHALRALADLRAKILRGTQTGMAPRWLGELLFDELSTAIQADVLPAARSRFELTEIRYRDQLKKEGRTSDPDDRIWKATYNKVDEAIRTIAEKLDRRNSVPHPTAAKGTQRAFGSANETFRVDGVTWTLRVSGPLHGTNSDDKRANIRLLPEISEVYRPSAISPSVRPTAHRLLRLTVLPTVLASIAVALFVLPAPERPAQRVHAELRDIQKFTVRYAGQQSNGYSPLCGCVAEKRPEEWWGLAFVARAATLTNNCGCPFTKFTITGAAPTTIRWRRETYRVNAVVEMVDAPQAMSDSDLDTILAGRSVPASCKVLWSSAVESDEISLVTKGHIHVSLRGDTPVAAWLPRGTSTVSVESRPGVFNSAPGHTVIRESYQPWPESLLAHVRQQPQDLAGREYPLADFLGPVVFWSDDADALLNTTQFTKRAPAIEGRTTFTIVHVTKPPFSARVAVMPYPQRDYDEDVQRKDPSHGLINHTVEDTGSVEMKLYDLDVQQRDASAAYSRLAARDKVWIDGIPNTAATLVPVLPDGSDDLKHPVHLPPYSAAEFRYPPGPARPGINVFGPLRMLTLEGARGEIGLGANQRVSLAVPSTMELRNIRDVRRELGAVRMPVPGSRDAPTLTIDASADLYVDGQEMPERSALARYWRVILATFLVIAAVVVIASHSTAKGRTLLPKKRPTTQQK